MTVCACVCFLIQRVVLKPRFTHIEYDLNLVLGHVRINKKRFVCIVSQRQKGNDICISAGFVLSRMNAYPKS